MKAIATRATSMFHMAAREYGDWTKWYLILENNAFTDPLVPNGATIYLPDDLGTSYDGLPSLTLGSETYTTGVQAVTAEDAASAETLAALQASVTADNTAQALLRQCIQMLALINIGEVALANNIGYSSMPEYPPANGGVYVEVSTARVSALITPMFASASIPLTPPTSGLYLSGKYVMVSNIPSLPTSYVVGFWNNQGYLSLGTGS